MTIPATISAALSSIQAQVAAASPLAQASHATVLAIQLNAGALVDSVQSTLTSASLLDTWAPPSSAPEIVSGFLTVAEAANDQNTLSLMRGIVGRAAANLEQIS